MARRGPNTAVGKDVVRLNAVRHGIVSDQVPLPAEDAAAWDAFRAAVVEDAAPVGAVEEALAARIAELFWRLRRVAPYEADVAATARERIPQDFRRQFAFGPGFASVEEAEEFLGGVREAIGILGSPDEAPFRILGDKASFAFEGALEAAGAGDDITREDEAGWSRGTMRAAILLLAKARGDPPKDVSAEVVDHLAAQTRKYEEQLAFVLQEQDRMRRERALPPEQQLLTLAKYEAHLNRQLFQALHELEALQARRHGQPIPLARVQVSAGG